MTTTLALYIVLAVCFGFFFLSTRLMKTINLKNKEISDLKFQIERMKCVGDFREQ